MMRASSLPLIQTPNSIQLHQDNKTHPQSKMLTGGSMGI